ncbi:hypothetical protein KKH13_05165 [Patescibacteria group bacterium]|nr:hypothetical protein [Patescibacteria group bacterium]
MMKKIETIRIGRIDSNAYLASVIQNLIIVVNGLMGQMFKGEVMDTCENCKYWKIADNSTYKFEHEKIINHGSCNCEKFRMGYYFGPDDLEIDEVWIENDEGWSFYTGKQFGCIHYENR